MFNCVVLINTYTHASPLLVESAHGFHPLYLNPTWLPKVKAHHGEVLTIEPGVALIVQDVTAAPHRLQAAVY